MKFPGFILRTALFISLVIFLGLSCGKGGGSTPPPNPGPCSGITVSVTGIATNPTNFTSNDGSISVGATGGSGFTFNINGGAFQSSGVFSNLAPGSYTIGAKNSNGCTGSAGFVLTAPNPCGGITITVTGTIVNPSTPAATDGSINASASGSTGFTFSINGGTFQSSGTFTGLGVGSYLITAKDGNGCTGSANFNLIGPNICNGVNIIVNNNVTNNIPCQVPATGAITSTPSGGTAPYTFSLNGGAFQASSTFSNLIAGNYTITAKDFNGCMGTNNATVANVAEGPLFTQVRILLQNNCVSCHNSVVSEGGMNWTIDCNIVTFKDRIKARAVDGNPSPMPQTGLLPASERQKITNWINAGGRFTD